MVIFPSGLYCLVIWQAVLKYSSQMSAFHSLNTFAGEALPRHAVARQEKEDLGTLTEMEDEGHLHTFFFFLFLIPTSPTQRSRSSLQSFVFSFGAHYMTLLLHCFANLYLLKGTNSDWGPLCQAVYKDLLSNGFA